MCAPLSRLSTFTATLRASDVDAAPGGAGNIEAAVDRDLEAQPLGVSDQEQPLSASGTVFDLQRADVSEAPGRPPCAVAALGATASWTSAMGGSADRCAATDAFQQRPHLRQECLAATCEPQFGAEVGPIPVDGVGHAQIAKDGQSSHHVPG